MFKTSLSVNGILLTVILWIQSLSLRVFTVTAGVDLDNIVSDLDNNNAYC